MGVRGIIAAAAAAAPVVRRYLHKHSRSDDSDGTVIPSQLPYIPSASLSPRGSESPSVEEMARRPLLVDTQRPARQSSGHGYSHIAGPAAGYGTILNEGPSTLRTSPERLRRDSWLDRVPEEAPSEDELGDEEELDLEEQGYYGGSYTRTIALYALVPLTSFAVFIFLASLPEWVWVDRSPTQPTLPRYFPSPLSEFIISAAFWSLCHHLRMPLYSFASYFCPRILDTIFFNVLYVLLSQFLRLTALATLRVRHEMTYPRPTWHDDAFRSVWWLALGWGLAEAATSIAQGYQQLALYRNVMVPAERVREILAQSSAHAQWGTGSVTGSGSGSREYMPLSPRAEQAGVATESGAATNGNPPRRKDPMSLEETIRLAVDQDVEQLIHLQEREELEEVYGIPLIYIPVFVPCLQRIDSFLFSLGFTLILAWAYLLSPMSFPSGYEPAPIYSNRPLAIAFPLVVVVHLFLSLLHSPFILPRIGVHTTAYVGLLVGLGGFFTGLGLWDALS